MKKNKTNERNDVNVSIVSHPSQVFHFELDRKRQYLLIETNDKWFNVFLINRESSLLVQETRSQNIQVFVIRVCMHARATPHCFWSYCSFTRLLYDDKYAHDDFSNEYKHINIQSRWIDSATLYIFMVPLSRWVSSLGMCWHQDVNYTFTIEWIKSFVFCLYKEQMSSNINVQRDIDTHTRVFTSSHSGRAKTNRLWI